MEFCVVTSYAIMQAYIDISKVYAPSIFRVRVSPTVQR
jgi:hypothetical protein